MTETSSQSQSESQSQSGERAPVFCALVHHPVLDRRGEISTTAVTNLDVHDLARSARTYDLQRYYVVTPITAQRAITERIVEHWTGKRGPVRVPSRTKAWERVIPVESLEMAVQNIAEIAGKPRVVATAARSVGVELTTFAQERETLAKSKVPTLLLFGTGHGLAPEVLETADALLEPIVGIGDSPFNHLSVRAAFAIVLDRLFGAR